MALSGKLSVEVTLQTPAAKYFNIFITQFHTSFKTFVKESLKPRCMKVITDGKPFKLKEKIEAIDKENKSITYNFFDGDISKNYKVFKVFLQVFEKSDGGASIKFTIEYEKINENVEAPYGFLEFFEKSAKDIDSHLLKA
ncbi:MLP-like protein 423 isoform X1 [Arachis stenosperma]|uniref:MLP-like protein 423 isoform X1 n=1 Tax=Arachis stenosperma TaxID=217475 RepID=UPI0025ACD73E|nr:MLP-like protein 423 isoform X1 [Arachis stenosperma]